MCPVVGPMLHTRSAYYGTVGASSDMLVSTGMGAALSFKETRRHGPVILI